MALPQPIHIFRKDLSHLWPETLVVLALVVAFAWSAPSRWTDSPYASAAPLLSAFLKLLLPLSWIVVISRLIHDEPLVGDRQFWTSRPYHWASLLAAKLLFLAVFLYLPFLLMQVYLLLHAGLHPTTAIPALLHNLLLLTVGLVIPVAALAAVTASFARLLLSVLGAMLYLLVVGLFFGWLSFQRMPPPALKPLLLAIVMLLPAAVLVFQYATRKTLVARTALAATPLVILLLLFLTPATALIRHAYPVAPPSSSPTLAALPSQYSPRSPRTGDLVTFRNQVQLALPFTVTGADPESNYIIQGASLTVDGPGGLHSVSPYTSATGQINAGVPFAIVNLPLPVALFNKIKSAPADLHLSLATDHLKAEPVQTWKATLLPFAVPGNGLCSFSSQDPTHPPTCRYPFKAPALNLVSAPLAVESCSSPSAQSVPGAATLGQEPGFLDFDPVVTVPLRLRPRQQTPPGTRLLLCPGTSLAFIEARIESRVRFEFDEKGLLLENYATHLQPSGPPQSQEESQSQDQLQSAPPLDASPR